MKNRPVLQRMVTEQFVANYRDPDTQRYGASYPGILYDYCVAALRKNHARAFRLPTQGCYGGHIPVAAKRFQSRFVKNVRERGFGWIPGAIFRRIRRLRQPIS
jgi:hypothetical protein